MSRHRLAEPVITGHGLEMAFQIREELERRGVSQKAFAEMVGTTEARVSSVLCGVRRPRSPVFDEWAEVLGMCWRVDLIDVDQTLENVP